MSTRPVISRLNEPDPSAPSRGVDGDDLVVIDDLEIIDDLEVLPQRKRPATAHGAVAEAASGRTLGVTLVVVAVGWLAVLASVVGGGLALAGQYSNDSAATALYQREVSVQLLDFEITPDVISVKPLTEINFVVENLGDVQHDLTISERLTTGRMAPGERAELASGVIQNDLVIWCSIKGHREQGMEAFIQVTAPEGA